MPETQLEALSSVLKASNAQVTGSNYDLSEELFISRQTSARGPCV